MAIPRRTLVVHFGTTLIALGALAVAGWGERWSELFHAAGTASEAGADQKVPTVTLPWLGTTGAPFRSVDLVGRVHILHLWASWCSVCQAERPKLKALASEAPGAVIGIATLDTTQAARAAERLADHGFPSAVDEDGRLAQALSIEGVPQTLVVSADGRIKRRFRGALSASDLQDIRGLLGRDGGPPHELGH